MADILNELSYADDELDKALHDLDLSEAHGHDQVALFFGGERYVGPPEKAREWVATRKFHQLEARVNRVVRDMRSAVNRDIRFSAPESIMGVAADIGKAIASLSGAKSSLILSDLSNLEEKVQALEKVTEGGVATQKFSVRHSGTGKLSSLDERRLAREPDGTRLPPLSDVAKKSTTSLTQTMDKFISEDYPHVMAALYPRVYEDVGQYNSPRCVATWLSVAVAETIRYGYNSAPTAYRLLMPAVRDLVNHRVPMFFIARDLLEAVELSRFDSDIDWSELKLPYEHGIFVLPKGALIHPIDGEVAAIVWSRTRAGLNPSPFKEIPDIQWDSDSLSLFILCPGTGTWYEAVLSVDTGTKTRINNIFLRGKGDKFPETTIGVPGLDKGLEEEDYPIMEQMGVVVFGTIMAMNARPDLVERARMVKQVQAKGDRPAREFWSPNVVGKKYKFRREVPTVTKMGQFKFSGDGEPKGGTHASPRMHWRCGHFREQPYGPNRRERRTIWLEPTLVAAIQKEDKSSA